MRTFFLAVVVAASACAPTAGDACLQVESYCNSGNTVLWCDGGRWVQFSCPGPNGCFKQTANTLTSFCDFINSKAGDRCPSSFTSSTTPNATRLGFCVDAKTERACVVNNGAGVWTDRACPGACNGGCI